MIYMKVFNPAGETRGRPEFDLGEELGGSVWTEGYAWDARIQSGDYTGEILSQKIEGRMELYSEPYDASVDSYRMGITERGFDTVLFYWESYEDPIKYKPYWETDRFLNKVDLYAEQGVEFEGNKYRNVFSSWDGDDRLSGGAGDDVLRGNGGNDIINGDTGRDRLFGGKGDDVYLVDNARDVVVEQASQGRDEIRSYIDFKLPDNVEDLWLFSEEGLDLRGTGNGLANKMRGAEGKDVLIGRDGSDTLNGGFENDRLIGGAGTDTLTGGRGKGMSDTFIFRSAAEAGIGKARDVITDFRHGDDRIDIARIDADSTTPGNQAFTFIGAAGFSGEAGQLRSAGSVVSGDIDGDGAADFQIGNTRADILTEIDFIL